MSDSFEKELAVRQRRHEDRAAVAATGVLSHRSKRKRQNAPEPWIVTVCQEMATGATLWADYLERDGKRLNAPVKNLFRLLYGGYVDQPRDENNHEYWHLGDFTKPFRLTAKGLALIA